MTADGVKGSVEIVEPTRAERTIGRRAAETRATVPDMTLSADVDMSRSLALARDRSASLTAAMVRACALALREHPRANGAYRDGRFELYSRVNAGVVLPSGEAATVLDADAKELEQLSAEIDEKERREPGLTTPELSGATFTFADLGRHGVTRADPLIAGPHAVALAAGEMREVAAARGKEIVATQTVVLTLTCDLRILHGAQAARVLARIRELLERGEL